MPAIIGPAITFLNFHRSVLSRFAMLQWNIHNARRNMAERSWVSRRNAVIIFFFLHGTKISYKEIKSFLITVRKTENHDLTKIKAIGGAAQVRCSQK